MIPHGIKEHLCIACRHATLTGCKVGPLISGGTCNNFESFKEDIQKEITKKPPRYMRATALVKVYPLAPNRVITPDSRWEVLAVDHGYRNENLSQYLRPVVIIQPVGNTDHEKEEVVDLEIFKFAFKTE